MLRNRIINLSEVICYQCNKPLGTGRTLVYDEKTKTGKGWRHGECPDAVPDLRVE